MGCHARGRVNGEAAFYEFASRKRDAAPVFERRKGEISDENCLHLFKVGVSVEGSVAAKEEVCDDSNSPHVTVMKIRTNSTRIFKGKESFHTLVFHVLSS